MTDAAAPPDHQIATGHIERAQWDDPDDTGRQGSYVRAVHGFRVADPRAKLHAQLPDRITKRHVKAATMLRDDYDVTEGAGYVDSIARMATAGCSGSQGAGLAMRWALANKATRGAQEACGRVWDVVAAVVLHGMSATAWGARNGRNGPAAVERLSIGLDALADFYGVEH